MSGMILKKVEVEGSITENTYFYIAERSKSGVIIDPGAETSELLDIVKRNDWHIERILITHGHFDHIGAVEEISSALNIPYFIHKNGERYLGNPVYNFSAYYKPKIVLTAAKYFEDGAILGDENDEDGVKLVAIHTPGHSSDSSTYYDVSNSVAFVGDTIFKGTIGATHFPGGNPEDMLYSIFNRIFKLPEDTKLYPGHGDPTTVKDELINIGPWIMH